MLKKLKRSWGFHPRLLRSPKCDNPRAGNNSTISLSRGGLGVQALSPPSKYVSFVFCAGIKEILQRRDSWYFLVIFPFQHAIDQYKRDHRLGHGHNAGHDAGIVPLSLIHISEPTRRTPISYAVF